MITFDLCQAKFTQVQQRKTPPDSSWQFCRLLHLSYPSIPIELYPFSQAVSQPGSQVPEQVVKIFALSVVIWRSYAQLVKLCWLQSWNMQHDTHTHIHPYTHTHRETRKDALNFTKDSLINVSAETFNLSRLSKWQQPGISWQNVLHMYMGVCVCATNSICCIPLRWPNDLWQLDKN